MTDAQIILGIQNNNPVVWRYVSRNLKSPFIATLNRICMNSSLSSEDWEDIFQDSCVVLLENVKKGKFECRSGSTLFSYFVEIGKRMMQTAVRKKTRHKPAPVKNEDTPHIIQMWAGPTKKTDGEGYEEISTEEKQTRQDQFLDRVFDSMPDACKMLLKKFYWEHKPMDEIASILNLRNADTAKTKKNRCMNQFKDIARKLVESDEFAEDAVRACVERAVLRELLEAERIQAQDASIKTAALDINEEADNQEGKK